MAPSNSINPEPEVVEDFLGMLKLYSDGSIFRDPDIKPPNPYIHDDGSAVWKDCLFDATHNLHLRLYKPKTNLSFSDDKFPVICYFYGGGFCFGSRTYPNAHNTCLSLCSAVQAVVVTPDYRLAPENRLPAALDDGRAALAWLRDQAASENPDEWLSGGVDFERVFVIGDSCGGNIAHHMAVGFGLGSPELSPVKIRGYVLLSPFFGGTKRTRSEESSEEFWTQDIYDTFWRLSVPIGSDADHPWANPFGPASPSLEDVSLDPILVVVGGGEMLRDRIQEYTARLKELNKKINYVEFHGKQHGFFTSNSYTEEAKDVIRVITDFISEQYTV